MFLCAQIFPGLAPVIVTTIKETRKGKGVLVKGLYEDLSYEADPAKLVVLRQFNEAESAQFILKLACLWWEGYDEKSWPSGMFIHKPYTEMV